MPNKILKYTIWGSYFYFSFLLLSITLQYIPYNTDVAFLRVKQDEISKLYYKIAFFTHVYSSILLMVLGFIQFSTSIKNKYTKLHRFSGRAYAIIILFLSGPSGLIMSYHANGGIFSQIAFVILSFLWLLFTFLSVFYILKKNLINHQKFAIRSFALTLSAISLRIFKPIIASIFTLEKDIDAYRVVAWLGWMFNLIIAEIIIYYYITKKK
jgi:Predicted membrane protein (DUF2306)